MTKKEKEPKNTKKEVVGKIIKGTIIARKQGETQINVSFDSNGKDANGEAVNEKTQKKVYKRRSRKVRHNYNSYGYDSSLALFLNEIDKIPLLKRDNQEETELAKKMVAGDEDAKRRLIEANLRFVVNVAKRYQNQGLPLIDLINEGNLGLITAAEKFDPHKGYHFISYAVWWIKQSILKAISEKSRLIRLPLNRANELIQIKKLNKELSKAGGYNPSPKEIAKTLHMDDDNVTNLMNISMDYVSLEGPLGNNRYDGVLGDLIEDKKVEKPENSAMYEALKKVINETLDTLTDIEKKVINYRFGLNNHEALSLKEIGRRFNLTKERIRQIEKKAIRKLQHKTRRQKLKEFMDSF